MVLVWPSELGWGIPTWLMREQRLAQVKINQSINQCYLSRSRRDSLLKSLFSILWEVHVQGSYAMVKGKAALDVPVLCEGIDGEVWSVMAQQCWHVTLQATKAALLHMSSQTESWHHPLFSFVSASALSLASWSLYTRCTTELETACLALSTRRGARGQHKRLPWKGTTPSKGTASSDWARCKSHMPDSIGTSTAAASCFWDISYFVWAQGVDMTIACMRSQGVDKIMSFVTSQGVHRSILGVRSQGVARTIPCVRSQGVDTTKPWVRRQGVGRQGVDRSILWVKLQGVDRSKPCASTKCWHDHTVCKRLQGVGRIIPCA